MQLGKIYLIRHGEVEFNRKNCYIGSTDLELNDIGKEQARRVANHLSRSGISIIYASDLRRAAETGRIISTHIGVALVLCSAFRELDYGEWEGVPEAEVPIRYPGVFAEWRADAERVRIPGGETLRELKERAFPAFDSVAEKHQGESIAIVAHKSTNRTILASILRADLRRYREIGQANACINVIERRDDGSYVVEHINDCCHLTAHA